MTDIYHEELSGIVKGPGLFEGQQEWVKAEDYRALEKELAERHRAQSYTYIGIDGKSVLARELEHRMITAEKKNEKYRTGLEWIAEAGPRSTDSSGAEDAFAWCRAIAETALSVEEESWPSRST